MSDHSTAPQHRNLAVLTIRREKAINDAQQMMQMQQMQMGPMGGMFDAEKAFAAERQQLGLVCRVCLCACADAVVSCRWHQSLCGVAQCAAAAGRWWFACAWLLTCLPLPMCRAAATPTSADGAQVAAGGQ